jgi:hypothetical protein
LLSCLDREAYNVFLHAGTYTTGNVFMEDVLGLSGQGSRKALELLENAVSQAI